VRVPPSGSGRAGNQHVCHAVAVIVHHDTCDHICGRGAGGRRGKAGAIGIINKPARRADRDVGKAITVEVTCQRQRVAGPNKRTVVDTVAGTAKGDPVVVVGLSALTYVLESHDEVAATVAIEIDSPLRRAVARVTLLREVKSETRAVDGR
jgi:hypothetical protein